MDHVWAGAQLEGTHLTPEQLRNSAREILTRIAADMREPQTAAEQTAKSRGGQSILSRADESFIGVDPPLSPSRVMLETCSPIMASFIMA
ncbi:hypothetical protein OKW49_008488 [Paraburkholderia youngii]|uniref:hypothetical protein n=1 Tax=Paraburkholderia youngii TaxID=2782701 RepID=UPI003D1ADF81